MAQPDVWNNLLQQCKGGNGYAELDPPKSRRGPSCYSSQSKIMDIERAKLAALYQSAERLHAANKSRSNAVLERLGLSAKHDSKSLLEVNNKGWTPRTTPSPTLSSSTTSPRLSPPLLPTSSPTPLSPPPFPHFSPIPLSPTPRLTPTPTPLPPLRAVATSRPSRIPALVRRPPAAAAPVKAGSLLFLRFDDILCGNCGMTPAPPSTPAPPRRGGPRHRTLAVKANVLAPLSTPVPHSRGGPSHRTLVVTTKVPASPLKPAPPSRGGPSHGTSPVTTEVPASPSKAAPSSRRGTSHRTSGVKTKDPAPSQKPAPPRRTGPRQWTILRPPMAVEVEKDLRPLPQPNERLSLCLDELDSDDWLKKVDALETVRALAQHHSELLMTKLPEVCDAVTKELKNLRSAVASGAMDAIRELHLRMGNAMDPMLDTIGKALLLRFTTTTSAFFNKKANLALDALVEEGCSPDRILNALLIGLIHRNATVRGSAAQHLHRLMDIVGEDEILIEKDTFAKQFLGAIAKMALDAASDVRHHGRKMLQGLANKPEFLEIVEEVLDNKDRIPLQKVLAKLSKRTK
ncbi:tyrosine-protein phosphatase non-receptor type 23-like [Sebastes umbrosus]|uniref:tyrosine-protein phosphatase non-receptor type 23-like n=1 Tax=Sebastes umbrosus TaxID=72105 RepID=UPI00189DD838|nr:tyrosine-protein phosphatase non-receptor type 23-like [Sebastes umbrosus]